MNKINQIITKCPICSDELIVSELSCLNCQTKITGKFRFSKFNYIDPEVLYFIEIFIKNRGSIKQVEKEMDISYPTVNKYLNEAIEALGYKPNDEEEFFKDDEENKDSVIDKIKKGLMSVEDAVKKIKGEK